MSAVASKRWREKNPEAVREQKRRYYARHAVRLRALRAPGNRARAVSVRQAVFDLLGRQCVACGFNDERALQVDHVNGGGGRERTLLRNSTAVNKRVLSHPEDYQVLCANCNWIKRHERREFGTGRPVSVKTTSTITED